MLKIQTVAAFACVLCATAQMKADAVSEYLAYRLGDTPTIDAKTVHRHPDVWMLAGRKTPEALDEMKNNPFGNFSKDGTYLITIANMIVFVELRDGKVDPRVNLEALYLKQKYLVVRFFYESLLQDRAELAKIVTDVKNVSFGAAPAAGRGDMDQYSAVLDEMPPYRVSDPDSDEKTRSITYRIPVGSKGFFVKLVLVDHAWKIDTSKKTEVPVGIFFQ